MTDLTLHFEPDGCALVPLVGLEAIGHSYRGEFVVLDAAIYALGAGAPLGAEPPPSPSQLAQAASSLAR
jgi:hypothetical protein